jgi:hypothetical protein
MEDDIAKHTKNIYKVWNNKDHSFKHKLQEIAIEIFIIVFAVTLSIWLHNWSEHRHEQQEANKFLIELKEDLSRDNEVFKNNRELAIRLDNDFRFILSLKKNKETADNIIGPHTNIGFLSINFNTARYEGFKSSGKISTIENDELKNSILTYYQQTITDLTSKATFMNTMHGKILDATADMPDNLSMNDIFTARKVKSMYNLLEVNYKNAILEYDERIKQNNKLIEEIDKEVKE